VWGVGGPYADDWFRRWGAAIRQAERERRGRLLRAAFLRAHVHGASFLDRFNRGPGGGIPGLSPPTRRTDRTPTIPLDVRIPVQLNTVEFVRLLSRRQGYWPNIHQAVQLLVQSTGRQPTLPQVQELRYVIANPFLQLPGERQG